MNTVLLVALACYSLFLSGLFLVVAIGSHQVIEALRDRIDLLVVERDAALGETGPYSDTPAYDATVTSIFSRQLEQPSSEWPL